MAVKNEAEVLIDGKVITMSGYESPEYFQKVASYTSAKIAEVKKVEDFNRMTLDYQNLVIQLNIADDYFKAKRVADTLQGDLEGKDKEIYDLKHELIANEIKLETQANEIKDLKKTISEYQKTIIKLEANQTK